MWLIGLAGEALACGGFFCNSQQPVDQTGEVVIFEVEGDTITTHARIDYNGTAEEFAWVLPAAGVPELFLSSQALFDRLEIDTSPQLQLEWRSESGCESDADSDVDTDTDADSDTDLDSGSVQVLSVQDMGPYTAVVVDASSPELLVDWLQDNGFGVPDVFTDAVAPYVAGGMNFLALKLAKSVPAGTLPPLGVRWQGERPSVPITLTQVAAVPDLPLTVYVFGDVRAVPLSYLHVQLNPLTYDWFGLDPRWMDGIGRAADEAGGRAFATLFAGHPALDWSCDQYQTEGLELMEVALAWFQALPYRGFVGDTELLNVLRVHVPAPPGVDELDFYNFPYGYPTEWAQLDETFDPVAATADLQARIVEPCQQVDRMLTDSPYVTRMVSLLSPEEMVVDPVFGFNPELPEVDHVQRASFVYDCFTELGKLALPGGYTFAGIPTQINGVPQWTWLDDHRSPAALVIEQLSEEGEGEIVTDLRDEFAALAEASLQPPQEDPEEQVSFAGGGCSCGGGSPRGLPVWIVGLGLVLLGRQRGSRSS
jgi:hypothetical protein